MKKPLMILSWILCLMFFMSSQPVFMVIMLMMITLVYALYIYMYMGSFWFSYILMLVILSGIMVVFIYMASLIPNESFEIMSILFIFMLIFLILKDFFILNDMYMDMVSLKIWNFDLSFYNLYLISFLLIIMIMVVWFSCCEKGAIWVF